MMLVFLCVSSCGNYFITIGISIETVPVTNLSPYHFRLKNQPQYQPERSIFFNKIIQCAIPPSYRCYNLIAVGIEGAYGAEILRHYGEFAGGNLRKYTIFGLYNLLFGVYKARYSIIFLLQSNYHKYFD